MDIEPIDQRGDTALSTHIENPMLLWKCRPIKTGLLSVLIPAYNEGETIAEAIESIIAVLLEYGVPYEIVVVDDGSKDNTWQEVTLISQQHPEVTICGYKYNKGKGHALKHGFQFVQGDYVLFMDGDLDIPPYQIPRFLEQIYANGTDVVIGSKKHPLSKADMTQSRRFFSQCYGILVKQLFHLNVTDTQVGLKVFKREVLDRSFPIATVKRYAFDIELLSIAHNLGYKITEAPVEVNCGFNSRVLFGGIVRMFIDTMKTYYKIKSNHIDTTTRSIS